MRLFQLIDPHLLADPLGQGHGRHSLEWLRHGLHQALGLRMVDDPDPVEGSGQVPSLT
jgi:hypothetical protein